MFNKKEIDEINEDIKFLADKSQSTDYLIERLQNRISQLEKDLNEFREYTVAIVNYLDVIPKREFVPDPTYPTPQVPMIKVMKLVKKTKKNK